MATAYIDRTKLDALLGADTVARAEADTSANIDAVIASQCAFADGYVSKQVALPPSAQAIEQVAPIVADLVYCALYANAGGESIAKRKADAIKTLRDIAEGVLVLHVVAVADDPNTPEDESDTGAAAGSAPRLASRAQLGAGSPLNGDW